MSAVRIDPSEKLQERSVVTAVLRSGGKILRARPNQAVGSYRVRWSDISGNLEADPLQHALTEIRGETGLEQSEIRLVREGVALHIPGLAEGVVWVMHALLFEVLRPENIRLDRESGEMRWVSPDPTGLFPTVPSLEETCSAWQD